MIRRILRRLIEPFLPSLADFGIPDENGITLTEYGDTADRIRECRADDWDQHVDSALSVANEWLTDEDLFALRSHVAWASHPHEGSAAERIGGAR